MNLQLTQRLHHLFDEAFGGAPTLHARAPGRVNLIGEHTDYNGGFVLPCAISLETQIAARARSDTIVRLLAADLAQATDEFDLTQPINSSRENPWANYVRGVVDVLQQQGHKIAGVDLAIGGNIPQGSGLSSSASLCVAAALTLRELFQLVDLDSTALAQIAQTAESDFVGCKCGIMDQLASARGVADHASLLDCRSLDIQAIPLPGNVKIMIVHSGITRGLVDGEYNSRREQCEQAAAELGLLQLRDATLPQLEAQRAQMSDLIYRRARHVISENERTLKAARCLTQNDLNELGELMAASHQSMKNDFAITTPGIDQLTDILQNAIGSEGGARMTGGGFGGAVVALMHESQVSPVREAVLAAYRTPDGQPPLIMLEQATSGATAHVSPL